MSDFDPHIVDSLGNVRLAGNFNYIKCIDPASFEDKEDPLDQGNHVIDPSKAFEIQVQWTISGSDAHARLLALSPGNWFVRAFAESIGPGTDKDLGQVLVSVSPTTFTYNAILVVPAGTLVESNPGDSNNSGLYKIACSCFLDGPTPPSGFPGLDIIGFVEGPLIRMENRD
ncbi:MAG: hypothetical protein AAF434_13295 [Pseudomonadota bacterium]